MKFNTTKYNYILNLDNEVDLLARRSLMQVGLNYLHGTGHGIGAYLNVHEGTECKNWFLSDLKTVEVL